MHPFPPQPNPGTTLKAYTEQALLRDLRSWLGAAAPPAPQGMGDDTAVLPQQARNLWTTDSLVWGRHFDAAVSPEAAGAKLLKRNLSDIAAMGGRPGEALLAAFLPDTLSRAWLRAFVEGLSRCAQQWSIALVGGDLTQTDGFLGFNLSLSGSAERPLLRSTARVGHSLWVTGALGGSRAAHHHAFTPRLSEGQWLAQQPQVQACIDITDGLAKDALELLPTGTVAALDLEALPVRAEARIAAEATGKPAWRHALEDGEDYELLFSVAGAVQPDAFLSHWREVFATPLTCIGAIAPAGDSTAAGALVDRRSGQSLSDGGGYAHFS